MVDQAVISAEALERWHWLKGAWDAFGQIPRGKKNGAFKQEVEFSTGIQLKITPQWLIHKTQLRERWKSGNNRGSAIVIIIANASDAAYLCTKGLRFGGALKVVEKYREAGPGSVCLICCGIGHDCPGSCG